LDFLGLSSHRGKLREQGIACHIPALPGHKLPRKGTGPSYAFDDKIRPKYYRIQKISEGSISLADGNVLLLEGPSSMGTGLVREERIRQSRLIDVVNDRFRTDFTEADQLFFDQIVEDATSDTCLAVAANANPVDKFALLFGGHVERLMIERMGGKVALVKRSLHRVSQTLAGACTWRAPIASKLVQARVQPIWQQLSMYLFRDTNNLESTFLVH
jgi:hypothetical protein